MGDVVLGLLGEVQHGLIGGLPLDRVAQGHVLGGGVGVEGDGQGVDAPLQVGDHIPALDQIGVAVGVDAHRGQLVPKALLQLVHQPHNVVDAVGGLAVAAEDDLPVGTHVPAQEAVQGLLAGGLPLQPQGVLGVDGALLLPVAQAELAVAVAAVGEVHIQRALIFIGDGHSRHASFKC